MQVSAVTGGRHFTADDWAGLRALLELSRAGTFTAAADRLGVSQPTLTRQLQRLERRVGRKLVERTTRRTTLTSLGAALVAEAAAFDVGTQSVLLGGRPRDEPAGEVVMASLGVAYPDLVSTLKARWPAVEWQTTVMNLTQALTRMAIGDVDLFAGFRYPYQSTPSVSRVETVRFARIPLWVYLSESHPLASEETVALTALAKDLWIAVADDEGASSLVRVCRATGFMPRVGHRATDMVSIRELLQAGSGVTLGSPGSDPGDGVVARPCRPQPHGDMVIARRLARWPDGSAHDLFATIQDWYRQRAVMRSAYASWIDAHPGTFPLHPVVVDPSLPLDPFESDAVVSKGAAAD